MNSLYKTFAWHWSCSDVFKPDTAIVIYLPVVNVRIATWQASPKGSRHYSYHTLLNERTPLQFASCPPLSSLIKAPWLLITLRPQFVTLSDMRILSNTLKQWRDMITLHQMNLPKRWCMSNNSLLPHASYQHLQQPLLSPLAPTHCWG